MLLNVSPEDEMSRTFIRLRRVLFGFSCAAVFGFGATQAWGNPHADSKRALSCPAEIKPYRHPDCTEWCGQWGLFGYCGTDGYCHCARTA
jgi:hypothetical protein